MPPRRRRRPSGPLLIAILALFVALGGPAEARRLLTGKDVRDRSLQTRDLSRKAVKQLRTTPPGSVRRRALASGAVSGRELADAAVTAGKLAPGAVGPAQLAPTAVGSAQIAANAVGPRELEPGGVGGLHLGEAAVSGPKVADGSLDARDVTRFAGRFRVTIPPVEKRTCWSGEPVTLAPEEAGADISGDLVIVTPDASWPERELSFTVRNSANRSRFVLAGCNGTNEDSAEVDVGFRYGVIDLP
jgi:hypothetical protein